MSVERLVDWVDRLYLEKVHAPHLKGTDELALMLDLARRQRVDNAYALAGNDASSFDDRIDAKDIH